MEQSINTLTFKKVYTYSRFTLNRIREYEVSRNEKCLPAMLWKLLFDCMCVLRTAVCVSTLLLSNYLCTRSQFRFDLGITKTLLVSRGVHNSKGALTTNVLQLCFGPKATLKSSLLKRNLFIQENCLYKLILIDFQTIMAFLSGQKLVFQCQ